MGTNQEKEGIVPSVNKENVNTLIEAPVINGVYCFIGYGIDILDAEEPSIKFLKSNWLNSKAFENNASGYRLVQCIGNKETVNINSSVNIGGSVSETLSRMNISAGVDIKPPFFSANIEMKYGTKNEQKETAKYAVITTTLDLYTFLMDNYYTTDPMELKQDDYIDRTVFEYINNANITPEELFRSYGTHMIVQQSTGAGANIFYTYKGSENISLSDFSAAVTVGSSYFKAKAGVSINGKYKTITDNCRLTVTAWGGDSAKVVGASIESAKNGFNEWKCSLNEETATLSSIQSAMPIWVFAEEANRRAEIIDAFMNNARNREIELDAIYINKFESYVSEIKEFVGNSREQVKESIELQGYTYLGLAASYYTEQEQATGFRGFGYRLTSDVKEAITNIFLVEGESEEERFDETKVIYNVPYRLVGKGAGNKGVDSSYDNRTKPIAIYYTKDPTVRKPIREICMKCDECDIIWSSFPPNYLHHYSYNLKPTSPVTSHGWQALAPYIYNDNVSLKKCYNEQLFVRR